MSEFSVIKAFKDKFTKRFHPVGSVYKSDDHQRIAFLQGAGFLKSDGAIIPDTKENDSQLKDLGDDNSQSPVSDTKENDEQLEDLGDDNSQSPESDEKENDQLEDLEDDISQSPAEKRQGSKEMKSKKG